ncbi:putative ribonuclease H-like domain-containing protein [Tanacetum coccineum]
MNCVLVIAGTNSNDLVDGSLFDSSLKNANNDEPQPSIDAEKKDNKGVCKESGIADQEKHENSTQGVNTAGSSINTEPDMFSLEDNATATHANFFDDETKLDMSNITITYPIPSTPNIRIHKDHSLDHVIGDIQSGVMTRRITKTTNEQGFISVVYEGKAHEDLHTCLFACFLSQEEPKKVIQALKDPCWIEAMQEELLQFKIQQVWTLVDLPLGKRAIDEGIDYDEVFAPLARIEAIRLFLAYASFKDFIVYQMDVKSTFLYGKIKKEVYVCQPLGFEDPEFPDRVYKDYKSDTERYGKIFISQDKYLDEILKKFGFSTMKTASTPMETSKPLIKDENAKDDRSMIGSLSILTSSTPKIFLLYLKGQPKLGLWYLKDSQFDLEAYTDSELCWCQATAKAKIVNGEVQIQALVDGKKVIVTETSVRRALQLKDVEEPITDEAANEGMYLYIPMIHYSMGRKIVDLDADAEEVEVKKDFEVVKGGKEKDKGSVTRAEENSSKRAGIELEQERIKKQKIDDGQEEAKMKKHIEIVIDEEEIAFDVIPLATKPPIIVGWKIIKEGKIGYFQIIRADGSSRRYSSMIKMLQNIDKEDMENL